MSVILGIDPGSRFTGYAVVKSSSKGLSYLDSGVIKIPSKIEFSSKLFHLSQELEKLFLKFNITDLSIEKIFFGKNADSAFKLGHVRGVCLLSAARHDCEVFEYAAKYVKKVVTGSGASSKESVQTFVNQYFNLQTTNVDESDALALALCHTSAVDVKNKMSQDYRI